VSGGGGRRVARAIYFAAVALLAGDLAARLVTYAQHRAALHRYPSIEHRYHAGHTGIMAHASVDDLLGSIARYPAPLWKRGVDTQEWVRWTTFGEFPASGFRRPPAADAPAPGVVRIAFVGGSTTFDGYPEIVQDLVDARFGDGRVEVLNLGIPSSFTASSLLIMQRFLPRWAPHIVVSYEGINDLIYYRSRARALHAVSTGAAAGAEAIFLAPSRSRGLAALVSSALGRPALADPWLADTVVTEPVNNLWEMSRLAWRHGFDLYVSTFAHPDYPALSERELDYYDKEVAFIWPMLGTRAQYALDIERFNRAVERFARESGTAIIDVAGTVTGGEEMFRDNCHFTRMGRRWQAEVVFEALVPRVTELLDAGAPPPVPRAAPPYLPLAAAGAPAEPPGGAECRRGPCPEGSCFVPAGGARYGNPAPAIAAILAREKKGIGWANPVWFADDGPEVEVEVSAFCIDRVEVPEAERAGCEASGLCPPVHLANGAADPALAPAIIPTFTDAEAVCAARGGRLPTDVEWEAAARGDDGRWLPWGNEWSGREANYCGRECRFGARDDGDDGAVGPVASGRFPSASPFGAVDMAGNLWEWAADCYMDSSHLAAAGSRDPLIVSAGLCRHFLRGGSYQSYAGILERRNAGGMPDVDVPGRGVRCVFDFGTQHHRIAVQGAPPVN
jgi:formylglycine-generating enzyme required for sulfatase activity